MSAIILVHARTGHHSVDDNDCPVASAVEWIASNAATVGTEQSSNPTVVTL